MRAKPVRRTDAPHWSIGGFALGARLALPLAPGLVAFGIAVGTTAARKGLGFIDSLLMSGLVFAGASQMVALEAWPERLTLGAVAALALVTATVNARMLLLGAALRPWLGAVPAWQTYPVLHFLTDPGWLISMRYREEGGSDVGVVLGSGVLMWAVWVSATSAGYLLGALISDPRAFALDLVMPIFFAVMLVPLWRGKRDAVPWLVAGAVALVVDRLVAGWWFVVAGALAGSVAGGFIDDR
jgi:predicted branched-subunit amino acid permease